MIINLLIIVFFQNATQRIHILNIILSDEEVGYNNVLRR